jgi:hypothetical protein
MNLMKKITYSAIRFKDQQDVEVINSLDNQVILNIAPLFIRLYAFQLLRDAGKFEG